MPLTPTQTLIFQKLYGTTNKVRECPHGVPALNPVNLRTIFLQATRAHYSTVDNYGDFRDELGCLTWTEDDRTSPLRIELSQTFDPKKPIAGPSIYVGFDATQFINKVIGSNAGPSDSRMADVQRVYDAATNLRVVHLAKSGDEALTLASMTAEFFIGSQELLKGMIGLRKFDPAQISHVQRTLIEEKAIDYYRCDVYCALVYGYTMRIDIEGHVLKKYGHAFAVDSP